MKQDIQRKKYVENTNPFPQVVNIDWLSFSLTLALTDDERLTGRASLRTPPGCQLIECKQGTPQYKRRVLVLSQAGDKLLTLLLNPYSSVINPSDMFVEVANALLYHPQGLQWLPAFIEQIHLYSWRSLSRLDVACDFAPTPHQAAVIRGLSDTRLYAQGKREGARFHDYERTSTDGKIKCEPRQLSWGAPQSAVKWKIYNKTKEITETDTQGRQWITKPWITQTWAREGLQAATIWRCECSLTGASGYDWRGEKMSWAMTQRENYEAWFYDIYSTRFTIRKNEGHKCRKNDTPVPFLAVPDANHYRTRQRIGDGEVQHVGLATTLRTLVKELEREECRYNPTMRQQLMATINTTIETGRLEGYFFRTFGCTWEEFAAEISTL